MTIDDLIYAVSAEIQRVFPNEFDGTSEEYRWLEANYGISEEDDVKWQLVVEFSLSELSAEDEDDEELMSFLTDLSAVEEFLTSMLTRYQSSGQAYHVG